MNCRYLYMGIQDKNRNKSMTKAYYIMVQSHRNHFGQKQPDI